MDHAALWGAVDEGVWARILVVSPHFDDAALGAAHLLGTYPDSTVVTVLGGRPPHYPDPPTDWDSAGGFRAGDDVVAVRREEDRAAMEVMGATPVWLDFPDHQYLAPDRRPTPTQVAVELTATINGAAPTAVFLPLGLANPDHVLTHDAGLLARDAIVGTGPASAATEGPGAEAGPTAVGPVWFCYEDAGYKHLPGLMAWRISKLFRSGLWPTPAVVPVRPDMAQKRAAIGKYESQLAPLERDHLLSERLDANVPEQFWRLEPPPPGWERLASSDDLDDHRRD